MEQLFDTIVPLFGHSVLFLFLLIGVIGSLIPAVPGSTLVWAAALIHGLVTSFDPLTGGVQVALLVLWMLSVGGQFGLSAVGAKRYGSTGYGIGGATAGLLVGTFAIPVPVVGSLAGAFLGALGAEMYFAKKEGEKAAKAGIGAALGAVLGMVVEFGLSLVMFGVIVLAFLAAL